eukprot:TRINITY_DN4766_c0_g1_i1.p1 TRINITY_DN4766_c0_g1~~TRINITY_DN4766_c0_g1_i1.p1  ORF type:complete len:352 (+),score=104.91 TRINITY_DN4766_c0_g1_i1:485-1540(+)
MTEAERRHHTALIEMVEAGGGYLLDGLFVARPGVLRLTDFSSSTAGGDQLVSFLVAGCSIETMLEFVAHGEFSVARLTSSRTQAMSLPLFALVDAGEAERASARSSIAVQMSQTKKLLRAGAGSSVPVRGESKTDTEVRNTTSFPCSKAAVFCLTGRLSAFHQMLIGRLSGEGNELTVVQVAARIADELHAHFPAAVQPAAWYRQARNSDKYRTRGGAAASGGSSSEPRGTSVLTRGAAVLFGRLGLCTAAPDYLQLADFFSRITYLTLPARGTERSVDECAAYVARIAVELGHTSILAGVQVSDGVQTTTLKKAVMWALGQPELLSAEMRSFCKAQFPHLMGPLLDKVEA